MGAVAVRPKCIMTAWRCIERSNGTWVLFIDHPFGADPEWAIKGHPVYLRQCDPGDRMLRWHPRQ
jgi:hypothetical protein